MENELLISNENIEDIIYTIRGKQVMLDSDVVKKDCHFFIDSLIFF